MEKDLFHVEPAHGLELAAVLAEELEPFVHVHPRYLHVREQLPQEDGHLHHEPFEIETPKPADTWHEPVRFTRFSEKPFNSTRRFAVKVFLGICYTARGVSTWS